MQMHHSDFPIAAGQRRGYTRHDRRSRSARTVITKFTYDSAHQLLIMKDPNCTAAGTACNGGNGVANVYTRGQVTQQTDYLGRVTHYDYTSIPFATKVTDPKGFITLYEYVGSFLLSTTREDQNGTVLAVTTYGYDPTRSGPPASPIPTGTPAPPPETGRPTC